GSARSDYYDRQSVIPDKVKNRIPANVDLIYWDYYHEEREFYSEWISRHRALGHEPIVASGIWTWARFWYDHQQTVKTATPCLEACRREKVRELFFTMWGDGGSFCEFDSALAGLTWAADLAYGGKGADTDVARIFQVVCGGDLAVQLIPCSLTIRLPQAGGDHPLLSPSTILWDDPLLGIGWQSRLAHGNGFWKGILAQLRETYRQLQPVAGDAQVADLDYATCLCRVLIGKLEFQLEFLPAYAERDRQRLEHLQSRNIPAILNSLSDLQKAFRRQWLRRNKPSGMEVVQIRLAAQQTRFAETATRLGELLDGKIDRIDEMDLRRNDLEIHTEQKKRHKPKIRLHQRNCPTPKESYRIIGACFSGAH
ncbi:MAG: hypothetical protein LC725_10205, partial [Lentisphaerae bacterium]|nr:hypothetical protein [Lentisphaerota bacterium]